jgi:hypothetical protein
MNKAPADAAAAYLHGSALQPFASSTSELMTGRGRGNRGGFDAAAVEDVYNTTTKHEMSTGLGMGMTTVGGGTAACHQKIKSSCPDACPPFKQGPHATQRASWFIPRYNKSRLQGLGRPMQSPVGSPEKFGPHFW